MYIIFEFNLMGTEKNRLDNLLRINILNLPDGLDKSVQNKEVVQLSLPESEEVTNQTNSYIEVPFSFVRNIERQ